MTTWHQLADELKTDEALAGLDQAGVEALLDILLVTIHADQDVGFMEQAEFEQMIFELPWLEQKHDVVERRIKATRERLRTLRGDDDLRQLLSEAAAKLEAAPVRAKAYSMAVTLAQADMDVNAAEKKVLGWLADLWGIPPKERTTTV